MKQNGKTHPQTKGNSRRYGGRKGSRASNKASKAPYRNNNAEEAEVTNTTSTNDPSWYYTNPETRDALCSYPFGTPLGFPLYNDHGYGEYRPIAGVARLGFITTVGQANDSADPINIAANHIYTKVRGANSGAKNYEPADLMMYLIAMDSLYMAYFMGVRAYGLIHTYNTMNRYVPATLVHAAGFDYDSFTGQTAQFKGFLDYCATRIASMAVPTGLTYYERHSYLSLSVFADGPEQKAQVMVPVPEFLWKYSGYTNRTGGELVPRDFNSTLTFNDYKELMQELIEAVITDYDCGTISGDIKKAFGDSLYKLPLCPPDFTAKITADPWFNMQVHNATLPRFADFSSFGIYQSNPVDATEGKYILATYSGPDVAYTPSCTETIIDVPADQVTPDMFLEATRFVCSWHYDADAEEVFVDECGSEILNRFIIYTHPTDMEASKGEVAETFLYVDTASGSTRSAVKALITLDQALRAFECAPYVTVFTLSDGNEPVALGTIGNFSNTTRFDPTRLHDINNMVFMKMLGSSM